MGWTLRLWLCEEKIYVPLGYLLIVFPQTYPGSIFPLFFSSPPLLGRNVYFKPLPNISGYPVETKLQHHKRERQTDTLQLCQVLLTGRVTTAVAVAGGGFQGWRRQKRLLRGGGPERKHCSYQMQGIWGTHKPPYFYFLPRSVDTGIRKSNVCKYIQTCNWSCNKIIITWLVVLSIQNHQKENITIWLALNMARLMPTFHHVVLDWNTTAIQNKSVKQPAEKQAIFEPKCSAVPS